MWKASACLLACLLATGVLAQDETPGEPEPPAPWKTLDGRNAGAVGTCSVDDARDVATCYLVRCDRKAGLVFAIQDPEIADYRLRSVRIEIGRFRQTLELTPAHRGEQTIPLAKLPKFLKALESGESWAAMETVDAGFQYSTGFDLDNAAAAIKMVEKGCKR